MPEEANEKTILKDKKWTIFLDGKLTYYKDVSHSNPNPRMFILKNREDDSEVHMEKQICKYTSDTLKKEAKSEVRCLSNTKMLLNNVFLMWEEINR